MHKFITKSMYIKMIILIILSILTYNFAQSQCILLLEKPGTVKNIKFRVGERIDVKTKNGDRINGIINKISDTAIIVNYFLIKIDEIKSIYSRRIILSALSHTGIKGSLGYTGIEAFNNLINNENPIFRNSTLKTGGIIFAGSIILKTITLRKRHIDNYKWRLKVLNFNILKDPGI